MWLAGAKLEAPRPPALKAGGGDPILLHMKQILVELDDRCARDLERVAPAKKRRRAEFIRLAIRSAVDRALEGRTERAYRARPVEGEVSAGDLSDWDAANELAALAAPGRARSRRSKTAA